MPWRVRVEPKGEFMVLMINLRNNRAEWICALSMCGKVYSWLIYWIGINVDQNQLKIEAPRNGFWLLKSNYLNTFVNYMSFLAMSQGDGRNAMFHRICVDVPCLGDATVMGSGFRLISSGWSLLGPSLFS